MFNSSIIIKVSKFLISSIIYSLKLISSVSAVAMQMITKNVMLSPQNIYFDESQVYFISAYLNF